MGTLALGSAYGPFGGPVGFGMGPFGGKATFLPDNSELRSAEQALLGSRITTFRFDVLDQNENLLGALLGVDKSGSSLKWSATSAVKGSGTLSLYDLNQTVGGAPLDWLSMRIRPYVSIEPLDETDAATEYPLGIWLASSPDADWSDVGRHWAISILDKTSVLDTDVMVDGSGNAITYSVASGTNIIATVISIISGMGESTAAILPDTKATSTAMTWDATTTKLQIVNDLLAAGGYFSLWCDYQGQFRCTPYNLPMNTPPTYAALAPFTDENSVLSPDWKHTQDIYGIPNRYVAVGQGSGSSAALIATATNMDPNSDFSYPSRGCWITVTEKGVQTTDLSALQAYAQQKLNAAVSVVGTYSFSHLLLPGLYVNSTVQFTNERSGVDVLAAVTDLTMPLDPTALCTSVMRQAVTLS